MVDHRELHRAPTYQRKFRWDEEAESRFIESILLGLPIPNLFFATNKDGTWEVVDGLQRISTLIHFGSDSEEHLKEVGKTGPLQLKNLQKLEEFNGQTFNSLPVPIQLLFTKRGLGVTALSDKSDSEARFDTFERLNRGAVALTAQEVRACIHEGPFNDLLRELAEYGPFRSIVKLQKGDEENATREELVLKFFAYLYDRDQFDGAVTKFLNNYMKNEKDAFDIDAGRALFLKVVDELYGILSGPLLRKTTSVTPQIELEAVMIGGAEVIQQHGRLGRPESGWLEDKELVEASTGGTNTTAKLRRRIVRAAHLLTPSEDGQSK
jgi:hypothetical protein